MNLRQVGSVLIFAWVLWAKTTTPGSVGDWIPADAWDTRQECWKGLNNLQKQVAEFHKKSGQKVEVNEPKGSIIVTEKSVVKVIQYMCFPDSLDPRSR